MRRILVEIPDDQLDALAAIAADEQRSQEAILRDAIAAYLARHMPARAAFGLWQGRGIEGLDRQQQLRGEWLPGASTPSA